MGFDWVRLLVLTLPIRTDRPEQSVDIDQMPQIAASDQVLHCLPLIRHVKQLCIHPHVVKWFLLPPPPPPPPQTLSESLLFFSRTMYV